MKSVGPDGIPGDILILGGEVMISNLARLLDIKVNNNAIPGDWKKALMVLIYMGGGGGGEIERHLENTDQSV